LSASDVWQPGDGVYVSLQTSICNCQAASPTDDAANSALGFKERQGLAQSRSGNFKLSGQRPFIAQALTGKEFAGG
jgi:hypothetical protein